MEEPRTRRSWLPHRAQRDRQQPKKAPLICESKTLLRRDQNEESTLVSYIVTDYREWIQWLADHGLTDNEEEGTRIGPVVVYHKRFGSMQAEARGHLKSKLPAYGVPSYCIFLNSMPSNPNGKVDSPNLPFPHATLISEEASEEDLKSWEGLSSTNKDLAEQWVTLVRGLNAKTLQLESDFFESCGDSLLAQQLLLNIRRRWEPTFPPTRSIPTRLSKRSAPRSTACARERMTPALRRKVSLRMSSRSTSCSVAWMPSIGRRTLQRSLRNARLPSSWLAPQVSWALT